MSARRGEKRKRGGSNGEGRGRRGGFRLNASSFFLTYSQCPLSPQEILDNLRRKVEGLDEYVIGQELHQDGNKHIHAFVSSKKKLNISNPRYFDIQTYHPKAESTKKRSDVIRYCTKEKTFITNISDDEIRKIVEGGVKVGEIHRNARKIAREKGVDAAMELLEHTKTARDLNLHGEKIRENLEKLVAAEEDIRKYDVEDFNIDFDWDRQKTLIIYGPSNLGKTCLARALLPEGLFTNSIEGLRKYDSKKYHGFILDDASLKKIAEDREAQLALVDVEYKREIYARYSNVIIPANTPRIITTNSSPETLLPFLYVHGILDEAIDRRIQRYNMTHRMFRTHDAATRRNTTSTSSVVDDATASAVASTVVRNDLNDDIDWANEFLASLNRREEEGRDACV